MKEFHVKKEIVLEICR